MELSNFNKQELIIIENFLNIATKIKNIYNNLYNLEIQGLKETNIYIKELEKLKTYIEKEEVIYKEANLTTEKNFKIIELLTNSNKSLKTNDIHSIINQDDRDIINRRIINNLIHLSINNTNNNNLNFLEELGIPNDNNELAKNINNYSKIELAINNDISLLFISILNEISLLKINLSYKKKLTKSLYNTLYINKNIEKTLLETNLNIPNKIYISSKFLNDLLSPEHKIYSIIIDLIIETQIKKHIIELLSINDSEYNNPKTKISSIINESYIRTLLTFLSNKELNTLIKNIYNLLEKQLYLNNNISKEILLQCLNNINHDKEKKLIISIKK